MELHFFTGKQPGFEQAAAIRQAVFVEEQGFHNEFDEIDETCLHCVISDGPQPVATCRAFAKEDGSGRWIIGRVAVSLPYRGQRQGCLLYTSGQRFCDQRSNHPEAGAGFAEIYQGRCTFQQILRCNLYSLSHGASYFGVLWTDGFGD